MRGLKARGGGGEGTANMGCQIAPLRLQALYSNDHQFQSGMHTVLTVRRNSAIGFFLGRRLFQGGVSNAEA